MSYTFGLVANLGYAVPFQANDSRCIGTVGCDIRLILDKTDVGGGIVLSSKSNGYPPPGKGIIQHICG